MKEETIDQMRRLMIDAGVPEAELTSITLRGDRTWDTQQLQEDFEVLGFAAPFVVVVRKSDRVRGSMLFTHWPRFYFNFEPSS